MAITDQQLGEQLAEILVDSQARSLEAQIAENERREEEARQSQIRGNARVTQVRYR